MVETYCRGYIDALYDIARRQPVDKFVFLIPRLLDHRAAYCRGYAYALEDEGIFDKQTTRSMIITIWQKQQTHWYVGYPKKRPVVFTRDRSRVSCMEAEQYRFRSFRG